MNVFPLDPRPRGRTTRSQAELRPLHGVGLSALLAPAVGLGGTDGRAACDGADRSAPRRPALSAASRPAASAPLPGSRPGSPSSFCIPLLVFASQIYPELPGALLVVVALRVMVRRAASPSALALGSTAAAALVWLHVRYLPLSLGVLARAWSFAATSTGAGQPPAEARGLRERVRQRVASARAVAADAAGARRPCPFVVPYRDRSRLFVAALLALVRER